MKSQKQSEIAYRAFCSYRNCEPSLPLVRRWRIAWGALAGAAAAGASTPVAYEAYRAVAGLVLPELSSLKDGELRAFRAACQAVRP